MRCIISKRCTALWSSHLTTLTTLTTFTGLARRIYVVLGQLLFLTLPAIAIQIRNTWRPMWPRWNALPLVVTYGLRGEVWGGMNAINAFLVGQLRSRSTSRSRFDPVTPAVEACTPRKPLSAALRRQRFPQIRVVDTLGSQES